MLIRRVRNDLFFVEWGNVRFGGTFLELATFAAELQAGMTKALAGDPEDKPKASAGKQAVPEPAYACMFCRRIGLKECDYGEQCAYTHPPKTADMATTAYALGRSHTCAKCENSNIPCEPEKVR